MARFTTTIPSRRAPADAFAYLADFANAREWDPNVVSSQRLDEGPPRVGSRYAIGSRFGPRTVELVYRIVELGDDRVVLEAERPGFVSRDTITVAPAGSGSSVTYDAVLAFRGLGRIADPLMQLVFSRVGRRAEARLREVL